MELADAVLMLRDPNLSEHGLILAAKLAARELGPVVIAHDGGLWNTDRIASDEEWLAFGRVRPGAGQSARLNARGRIRDLSRANVLGYG
jgi:hypothetical protein